MSSNRQLWLPGIAIVIVAGCVDEPPQPDVSNLTIVMSWKDDTTRGIDIRISNPDIPCDEVDEGFLGESAVECVSGPWTLTVDGVELNTHPIKCWSAHDGLFGHTPKRCDGGTASMILQERESEDVELVAMSNGEENRIVLHGIRKTHTFVQETPLSQGGASGLVRVDDLVLASDVFTAIYSRPGTSQVRDAAYRDSTNRLRLSPTGLTDGAYQLRVLARATQGRATIAIPIEGALTVGQ